MRSLENTGIGLLPFVPAREVLGIPLEMRDARHRSGQSPDGRPNIQVAFTFHRLDESAIFDSQATVLPLDFVVTQVSGEARDQYVRWFERETESIGPVEFIQMEAKLGQSGAYVLVPYQPTYNATPVQPAQSLPAPATRPVNGNGRVAGNTAAPKRASAAQVSRVNRPEPPRPEYAVPSSSQAAETDDADALPW